MRSAVDREIAARLGDAIRQARKELGVGQDELSIAVDAPGQAQVSCLETHNASGPVCRTIRILAYLGIDPADLVPEVQR